MAISAPPKPFVIPIFLPHAGCPNRCLFCDQTRTTSQRERLPSVDQLHETIVRFLSYRKDIDRYTEISFFGGNFLGLPADAILWLLESVSPYITNCQVQGIRFSTRPDTIDSQRLNLLTRFEVTTVELGVQSMNNDVLMTCRRGHCAEDTYKAVDLLKAYPYRLGLQMMVGLPGDTPETALTTGEQISELSPDFVRIYPTLVLKGSPLARWYAQDRYAPLTLESAVALVKLLYLNFVRSGIKVVRMGLQPTDELQTNAAVLAGPFHPAFGELVHSALWLDAIRKKIIAADVLEIRMHPKLVSRVKGHKKNNFEILSNEFGLQSIKIANDRGMSLDRIRLNGRTCRLF